MVKDTELEEDCNTCEFYKSLIRYIVNGKLVQYCTLGEIPKSCNLTKNRVFIKKIYG